jgi:spoIIIJ-associated protein
MEQPMDHGNVEFEGKNLDVAIWKASQELGIPIEKLRYTILSPGKRGPGGVSVEPARIRILSGEAAPPLPPVPAPRSETTIPKRISAPRIEPPAPIADVKDEEVEKEEVEPEVEVVAFPDEVEDDEMEDEALEVAALPEALADEGDEEDHEDERDEEDDEEDEPAEEDDPEDDDEPLDDEDDLEDLPLPMATSIEEDDPIEEARRARQDRGTAPERRMDPPEPPPPARAEPVERQRPSRREHASHGAPRPERPQPPPRRSEDHAADPEPIGGMQASGASAIEDLEGGMARAREVLPELLAEMGFGLTSEFSLEEDHVYVALTGDDAAYLVDDRAEGLNSLQYLLNKMVYRGGPTRIVVDANGYRKERQQEIVARAIELAQEVRDSGEPRSLGTLNPFERRLVHMALREDPTVRTVSHGDAFLKRLEITPKRGEEQDRSPRFPSGWDRDGSTSRHGRPRGGRGRGGR